MATCTVTLAVNQAAVSGLLKFNALINQVVGGKLIDQGTIIAAASGTAYTADLEQNAWYYAHAPKLGLGRTLFMTPASPTADLEDLLETARVG